VTKPGDLVQLVGNHWQPPYRGGHGIVVRSDAQHFGSTYRKDRWIVLTAWGEVVVCGSQNEYRVVPCGCPR
jgi:hypothetical protein